jgi:hypothetical protein
MGISFDVEEDLAQLYATRGGREGVKSHLLDSVVTHPESIGLGKGPKSISPLQADMVLDFYEWAQGDQPYCILRKGLKCLGLYKKTSKYVFKNSSNSTLPHRVSYQFVRLLQEDEARPWKKGQVTHTLFWQELQLPTEPKPSAEQSINEVMERLSRTREAIAALVTDLDAALTRFHRSLV